MRLFYTFLLLLSAAPAFSQKMLLLERANRAATTKIYIGMTLQYRLAGEEDYWYERTITDMLPESNTLLLDGFPVKVGDISEIKVRRKAIWRIIGGTVFAFGASLAIATTVAALYRDEGTNYGALYATSAAAGGAGYFLNTKRKLKLGEKHRLRVIEINFSPPAIPKQ